MGSLNHYAPVQAFGGHGDAPRGIQAIGIRLNLGDRAFEGSHFHLTCLAYLLHALHEEVI